MREKLGRLVLLEEVEDGPLGREYRAARLGPAGLDRLVAVLRFGSAVSSHAEATRRLVEEARTASQLQNPGLVRVLGIGRVDQSFYVSTELVEGRTLSSILERCRREGFPFATEHALMVASRAASALEYLHGKKDGSGRHLIHGLLAPSRLVVTFDGDVKVKGVGLWPALKGTGLLTAEESLRLAPEQATGAEGSGLSDVYALGLILLEVLAGRAPGGGDPLSALAHATVTSTSGEKGPLPPPLVEVLKRSLAAEPAARFAGMADFRKAVDALLFSGDFTPTTFDLAFFMHTLFREEMERDAAALEEARTADYTEFLSDAATASRPATKGAAAAAPVTAEPPTSAGAAVDEPAGDGSDAAAPAAAAGGHDRATEPEPVGAATPPGEPSPLRQTPRASRAATREAASRLTFGASASSSGGRRGLWLALGLLGVAGAGGGLGWLYLGPMRVPNATPPSTLSPEATAALARVKELEARIADLEREKQDAENRAAETARLDVEAKAAAGGRAADPASVAAAQEQARRRARAEQEARQQEELRRLAAAKKAEEDRIAAEQRAAAMATPTPAPTPPPTPASTPTPTPVALPMPTPAQALASTPEPVAAPPTPPPVRPGDLVDLADPEVKAPVLVDEGRTPEYPALARQLKRKGTVVMKLLIDEQGKVVEVRVDRVAPRGFGFDAAAERAVVTRRYRPASKAGVPVRVWLPLTVNFSP